MLIPQQKNLILGKNRPQEMISLCPFSTKIVAAVYGWVYRTLDLVLGFAQGVDKIGEKKVSHNQEIDVTFGKLIGSGDGPMYERNVDDILPGGKGTLENVRQPNCFRENALKLSKDRTLRVRAKIDLTPFHATNENADFHQGSEFTLQTGRRSVQVPSQIAQIPPAFGMEQGGRQQVLPNSRPRVLKILLLRIMRNNIRMMHKCQGGSGTNPVVFLALTGGGVVRYVVAVILCGIL